MKFQKKTLFHALRALLALLVVPSALLFAHHMARGHWLLALLMAVTVVGTVCALLTYTVPKDGHVHVQWPSGSVK